MEYAKRFVKLKINVFESMGVAKLDRIRNERI